MLEKVTATFLPLASFAFGETALVAFLAPLAVLFVGQSPAFRFGENLARRVIKVAFARQRGADSFFDELKHFDVALVGVVRRGDLELVAKLERCAGLEGFPVTLDLAGRAVVRSLAARFVKSNRPEPLINAHFPGELED